MKNFQNYTPEKYAGPEYQKVEDGIYLGKNPYWRPGFGQERIYVTSLSFEMEPDCYGEEGKTYRLEAWTRYPENVPLTGESVEAWPTAPNS